MSVNQKKNCLKCFFIRLHGRYHELAPHLVPMDYTNDPDCKLPLALIVNMPELKVNKSFFTIYLSSSFFLMDQPQFAFHQVSKRTLKQTRHPLLMWADT